MNFNIGEEERRLWDFSGGSGRDLEPSQSLEGRGTLPFCVVTEGKKKWQYQMQLILSI